MVELSPKILMCKETATTTTTIIDIRIWKLITQLALSVVDFGFVPSGAETEGFPSISHGMFPRGGAELVHFFYASSNQALATILAEKVQQQGEQ